ncbi:MAG: kelch repeat-containing protein [Cyclobacteriaceae bacterium]
MNKPKTTIFCIQFLSLAMFFLPLSETKAQGAVRPEARWGHVLIHDPTNNQILLFGGTTARGGKYLDDTWIWEKDKWSKLSVAGPESRGFCAVTFHEERETVILHGGRGNEGVTYSDLWEWDGKGWTQLEKESPYKADHHQIVYLGGQKMILGFGGWNGSEVLGDTWTWSGDWKKLDVPSPPNRASHSVTYDRDAQKVILYGGLWINGQYADIWEFDGKWSQVGGPYENSSLDHYNMIYDSERKQIVGFGGKNYRYNFQRNTFKIVEGKVTTIASDGPSGRHSFGFTFDRNQKEGFLFGGKEYVNEEQLPLGDFWKWNGEKWVQITPSEEDY